MGGTFDPIHNGHLVAASEVASALKLDQVVFVPTGEPWQKQQVTEGEHRYLMTVVATAANPQGVRRRRHLRTRDRKVVGLHDETLDLASASPTAAASASMSPGHVTTSRPLRSADDCVPVTSTVTIRLPIAGSSSGMGGGGDR